METSYPNYPIESVFTYRDTKLRFVITDRFTREGIEYVSVYGPFPGDNFKSETMMKYCELLDFINRGVLKPKFK